MESLEVLKKELKMEDLRKYCKEERKRGKEHHLMHESWKANVK